MLVIGLHGSIGAGKSTSAHMLCSLAPEGAVVRSFAAPLKDAVALLCLFTQDQVRGTQEQKEAVDPRWGKSPRDVLKLVGDALRQGIHTDFFLKHMDLRIAEAKAAGAPLVVIDDVRYKNELLHIQGKYHGVIVRLVKGAELTAEQVSTLHPTEQPLPAELIDMLIHNDDTLDELRVALYDALTLAEVMNFS